MLKYRCIYCVRCKDLATTKLVQENTLGTFKEVFSYRNVGNDERKKFDIKTRAKNIRLDDCENQSAFYNLETLLLFFLIATFILISQGGGPCVIFPTEITSTPSKA